MAKLLQGGHKEVTILTNTTHLTSYGIYTFGTLTAVAVVNLEIWNSTEAGTRPGVSVVVKGATTGSVVRRLTAPGVEVKTGMTWAGQAVDSNGKITGAEVTESLNIDGSVLVSASEAVLITL